MFRGGDLRSALDHQRQRVRDRIDKLSDDQVLEADVHELASDLADEFEVHPIELDREDISYDQVSTKVPPGRDRDPFFGPVDGVEVRFFVPFTGDKTLFQLRPGTFTTVLPRAERVGSDAVELRYAVRPNEAEGAADLLGKDLDLIEQYTGWQEDAIEEFNDSLLELITEHLEERQRRVEESRSRLEDRGFKRRATPTGGSRPPRPRRTAGAGRAGRQPSTKKLDVFISHASEDKADVARPIFQALSQEGVRVWFDEAELTLGDSLRRRIDEGLARCRFGVVVLSHAFFRKEWPQRELDGLVARETATGEKAILPIWHGVDQATVAGFSPTLADRVAASTQLGLDHVVDEILKVLGTT